MGFEPTVEFPLHTLSKRAPSTARTSLRFRINDLRTRNDQAFADCEKSSNVPRSLTGFSSIAAPVLLHL